MTIEITNHRWLMIIHALLVILLTCRSALAKDTKPGKHGPPPATDIKTDDCPNLDKFAKSVADFSYCSLTSSNKMCRNCINKINDVYSNYVSITSHNLGEVNNGSTVCPAITLSTQDLETVMRYYDQVRSNWFLANCDNCYEEAAFGKDVKVTREDVGKFFVDEWKFWSCVNDNSPNETCEACGDRYSELNNFYIQLNSEYQGNLCIDIRAEMTQVREKWSALKCNVQIRVDLIVVAVATLVIFASVLLYAVIRKFSSVKRTSILMPKRHSMLNARSLLSSSFTERSPLIN